MADIEDAGIREVLQTPGAAFSAWSILDALLTPTGAGTPFIFREPLGQAREVKVALSGLFGRFVARAYLERYFDLSIFAHLGSKAIDLDRRRKVKIKRLSRGDLPDWIACAPDLSSLTVTEAKDYADGRPPFGQESARRGRTPRTARKDALFIGLLRLHIANLIGQLGHAELADALYRLTRQPFARRLQGDIDLARILLDEAPVGEMDKAATFGGLVGGIITRAGPVADAGVTSGDQEMLAHLNLRPVFVGVERDLIRAAIDAEPQAVRTRLTQSARPDDFARPIARAAG